MVESGLKSAHSAADEFMRRRASAAGDGDPEEPKRGAADAMAALSNPSPVNILIVDDEPRNLAVLEAVLDDPGYRLVRTESAEQALLALLVDEFAVLIVDVRMPGLTGFELAQIVKQRKKTANVPIIFLTAYYNEDQHTIEGYGAGAVDYLHKPVNPAILRSKVGMFAELYRRQRDLAEANRALLAEVTSRRRAEEQLRALNNTLEQRVADRTASLHASTERLRAIYDGTFEYMWLLAPDGSVLEANRSALEFAGCDLTSVVGKLFWDSPWFEFTPGARETIRDVTAQAAAGAQQHFEMEIHSPAAQARTLDLSFRPLHDEMGRVILIVPAGLDITERKLAEAKLRDSERQLQELISAIPAAIYTTNAEGQITYFNQATLELTGRAPTIGSDEWCTTWKLYHPNGTPLPYDQSPMAIALAEGRAIRNAEVVAERPDGIRVPFIPYPTPLRDSAGKIIGAINMLVDISERKQAETQQRILLNELNHRVKNNMQMLQTLLDLGAQRAKSPEAREVLDEASGRITAMAAAQRVLYTMPDATRFDARDFLNTVCETAKQTFPHEVDIDYEADNIQLPNDAAMPLALIANELLTNAVKHGWNDRNASTILVRLKKEDEFFLFFVEDEGPGFDLQSVQRRSSGLALVQGLARQLRGTFEVTTISATRCILRFQ